jgi:hypothetical protein
MSARETYAAPAVLLDKEQCHVTRYFCENRHAEAYSVDVATALGLTMWRDVLRVKGRLVLLEKRGVLTSTKRRGPTGMGRRYYRLSDRALRVLDDVWGPEP